MASATIKAPGTSVEKLTDEKFPLSGRNIHLSVEVRETQLIAALLDKRSNKYVAWALFPISKDSSLDKILEDEILSVSASSVSVTFTQNNYILVPALYFKKEALKEYLSTQQLYKAEETPCYDYVKNLESYNLYTVGKNLDVLQKKYPGASFRHHSSLFIEQLLIENKGTEGDNVFVCVFNNYFDVAVIQQGKLVLSNRFQYQNANDFMYNLLWVYEQLKLNAEKVACTFYGEIEKSSDIFTLSSRYIKKTTMGDKGMPSCTAPLLSLSPHKYHSLFTQYLCV